MSHDQFKAAVRRRMAETGEPYLTARREYLRLRQAGGSPAARPGEPQQALSDDEFDQLMACVDRQALQTGRAVEEVAAAMAQADRAMRAVPGA